MSQPSSMGSHTPQYLPVWLALADLFVGKQLQDYDFDHIAHRLRETGIPISRIELILWKEVFPVFGVNVGALAIPELEGWSPSYIQSAIEEHLHHPPSLIAKMATRWRIKRSHTLHARWNQVRERLNRS